MPWKFSGLRPTSRISLSLGLVSILGGLLVGCSPGAAGDLSTAVDDEISQQIIPFTGQPVSVVVPAGAQSVFINAFGGSGGAGEVGSYTSTRCGAPGGLAAAVLGTLSVQPGQTLTVSVGGGGQGLGCNGAGTSRGGWGGLGGVGGAGLEGYSLDDSPSGGGGGATTVQGPDGSVVLVAAGGGGGGAEGITAAGGSGGSGLGPNNVPGNGDQGKGSGAGLGGIAGIAPSFAGENGAHGGGAGGDGGGGGGGAHGGQGGFGGQFGGGGGGGGAAGSSSGAGLSESSIAGAAAPGGGQVQLSWCDSSGCFGH